MPAPRWDGLPPGRRGPLGATESTLFAGPDFRLAEFHCGPEEPAWTSTNRNGRWPLVAFPGTALWIEHDGAPPFVADRSLAVAYRPGQEYVRRLLDPRGDHCTFVGFGNALLAELEPGADEPLAFRPGAVSVSDRAFLDFRGMVAALRRDPVVDQLAVTESVVSVLGSIFRPPIPRAASLDRNERAQRELAEQVRAVLNRRFHERLTLEDVAGSVHVSRFHMARVFRAVTGTTIHGYLTDLRLRAALARMGSNGGDLSAIAVDVGFAHHSHLTEQFRRRFGIPPSALRSRSERRAATAASSTIPTAASAGRP